MKKIILEARINEYAMRDRNPHVPWTCDEIVETAARCRAAGASILHFHARKDDGSPDHSVGAYGKIIASVRASTDILLLPTLGFISNDRDPKSRIDMVLRLAEDPATRPDIVPIDMGSTNLEQYDATQRLFLDAERVYLNTTATLEHYASELMAVGIKVKMTCWDVGFVRRGGLFLELGKIAEPGYFLFHLTDGRYRTGHPCTPEGVNALATFLPEGYRYEWNVNCLGGNLFNIASHVARRGGHLAIGIGDYSYEELGAPSNEELIRRAADIAREDGREIATPDDVRELLGMG